MRIFRTALALSLAATAGCLVEQREMVRDEQPVEAPPPPPGADEGTAPDTYAGQPTPPQPGDVESVDTFDDALSPYGYWQFVAPYGRVWVPYVGVGWRPYAYGQWELTDWGWTFVSDDPWGWAAYHYGRWNFGIGVGWYWIPGLRWGPAWVSWRWGGGYCAWAPLGPPGVYFGYRHPGWVAVRAEHFTRPIASVAVTAHATYGIVSQTQPLSGPHAVVARSGQFGPPVREVSAAVGHPIRPVAAGAVVGRARAAPGPRATANAGPSMRSPQPRGGTAPRAAPAPSSPRAAPPARGGSSSPGGPGYRARGWGSDEAPRGRGGGAAPRANGPPARGGGAARGGGGGRGGGGSGGGGGGHSGGGSTPHASGGGGHSSGKK